MNVPPSPSETEFPARFDSALRIPIFLVGTGRIFFLPANLVLKPFHQLSPSPYGLVSRLGCKADFPTHQLIATLPRDSGALFQ